MMLRMTFHWCCT